MRSWYFRFVTAVLYLVSMVYADGISTWAWAPGNECLVGEDCTISWATTDCADNSDYKLWLRNGLPSANETSHLVTVGANTDIYTFYSNTTTEFQKGDWWDIYLVPGDRVTSDNYREYFELSLPSFRVVDELSSEPQQNIRGSHCLGYYQQYQQYDGSTAELSQSDYNLGVAVIVGLAVGSAFIGFCGGVLLVLLSQCCYKRRRCHRLAVERHMVQPEISTTKREPTIEFQPRLLTESADHSHPKQELPLQHPGTPLAFNFDVPAAPISPPSPYAHELSASPVHPYTTIWQGPGLVKLDPVGRYNGSSVPDLSLVDEPGDIAPSPRRHLSPSPARKFRKTPGEPEFEMISKSSLHSINRVATPSNASQERPQT